MVLIGLKTIWELQVETTPPLGTSPTDDPEHWIEISITQAEKNDIVVNAALSNANFISIQQIEATFVGEWNDQQDYMMNNLVSEGPFLFYAKADSTGGLPPTNDISAGSVWEPFATLSTFSRGYKYPTDAVVNDLGQLYTRNSTAYAADDWDAGTDYGTFADVFYNNILWQITGTSTVGLAPPEDLDNWDYGVSGEVIPGINWDALDLAALAVQVATNVTDIAANTAEAARLDMIKLEQSDVSVIGDNETLVIGTQEFTPAHSTTIINEYITANATPYEFAHYYAIDVDVSYTPPGTTQVHYYVKYADSSDYQGPWSPTTPYGLDARVSHSFNGGPVLLWIANAAAEGTGETNHEPGGPDRGADNQPYWNTLDNPPTNTGSWKTIIPIITVEDTLTSTSTTNALSANQGRVLETTKQDNLVAGTNVTLIDNGDDTTTINSPQVMVIDNIVSTTYYKCSISITKVWS